jgi:pyruvate dehydrogenase E1 component alpha subunit
MAGVTVDGDDVLKVYEEAEKAVTRARKGQGPTLLECKTHRWFGHFAGDAQKYRSSKEIQEARGFDPIAKFQKFLLESKSIRPEYINTIETKIKSEIEEAIAFAENSPVGEMEELFNDVYA